MGERKIIELILDCLDMMPDMILSFGDDASAIELEHETIAVINMDMLVRKQTFQKK